MSFQARRELLAQVAPRYQEVSHRQKSIILDEFIAATGYVRKYAIRLLSQPVPPATTIKRRRKRRYGLAVHLCLQPRCRQEALATAWAAANFI